MTKIKNTHLSDRESECLSYVLRGKSARQIAEILNISPKTVESYIANIKAKWGANSKSDLIAKAVDHGLIMFTENQ